MYPGIASEFHTTKNGDLTPNRIHGGQPRDYWWLGACGHEWKARLTNRVALGAGCPECSLGGYSSTKAGILYFIRHDELGAFKVGITNQDTKSDRLGNFQKVGWQIIQTWESDNGRIILETESAFFQWLRREKLIPKHLGKLEMGVLSGGTETFSDSVLTRQEVIERIERILKTIKET